MFYLREIALSSKSGDSVYAKRLLLQTHLSHPLREAPLGTLTRRGPPQKMRFVHAKHTYFLKYMLGLTPEAAAGQGMLQDFSRVFRKLLFSLRNTTTLGTANSNICFDVSPKAPTSLFSH